MSKEINIIACIAKNGAIGLNNQLLYHLRADMEHFKALTMGHTIVMGRKTYESLPNGALPHRLNVVISQHTEHIEGCVVCHTLEKALSQAEQLYIIGGASIYRATLPLADHLYLTIVDDEPKVADTYFPAINWAEWKVDSRIEKKEQGLSFTILALHRVIS
nr:dihydrofolate reductase [uncultured Prevotella sp.]